MFKQLQLTAPGQQQMCHALLSYDLDLHVSRNALHWLSPGAPQRYKAHAFWEEVEQEEEADSWLCFSVTPWYPSTQ